MSQFFPLFGVLAIAFLVNLPCGYLRKGYEKFTFGWYFYVHISIPVIIYLRVKSGFGWHLVPFTLASAIAGQLVGGRLRRPVDTP